METLKIVAKGLPATVEDYQLALNAAFAGGVGFATAKSEQEQGEPVGEMQLSAIYEGMVVPVVSVELPVGTKLYTTPQPCQTCESLARTVMLDQSSHDTTQQQRKPLTIEEIAKLDCYDHFKFARAIEAAHGIKE